MRPFNPTPYQLFVLDFLEADTWAQRKEGVPLGLLDDLNDLEKASAERELLTRLSLADDWPIQGLAHLKSKAALPKLREMLLHAQGNMKITIQLAISKIPEK